MNILLMPMDKELSSTNERVSNAMRRLAPKHNLFGLSHTPGFATANSLLRYLKFISYMSRVFLNGVKHLPHIDIIYCVFTHNALLGAILSLLGRKPLVWETPWAELTYFRQFRAATLPHKLLRLIIEKIVIGQASLTVVGTESEKDALVRQGVSPGKVAYIPNCPNPSLSDHVFGHARSELRREIGLPDEQRILISVGGRDFAPNRDVAEWICCQLAPAISREMDDVKILITGSGPLPTYVPDNVMFTGFVPDLYKYIYASDICLAPVWWGAGPLQKMLDFMICAKPVVVTPFVAEKMPVLVDGYNALVARDEADFIKKVLHLLASSEVMCQIGANARKSMEDCYNWDTWAKKLNDLLEGLIAKRSVS